MHDITSVCACLTNLPIQMVYLLVDPGDLLVEGINACVVFREFASGWSHAISLLPKVLRFTILLAQVCNPLLSIP